MSSVTIIMKLWLPSVINTIDKLNCDIITIVCAHLCSKYVDLHSWFQIATLTGYNTYVAIQLTNYKWRSLHHCELTGSDQEKLYLSVFRY